MDHHDPCRTALRRRYRRAMTTTVLLADLPPLLEDIVAHLIQGQPDVRVLRGTLKGFGLPTAAAAWDADVVVVTRGDPADFSAIDADLARIAATSIVALNADGAWACVYSLRPECLRIGDVSGAQLIDALTLGRPTGRA